MKKFRCVFSIAIIMGIVFPYAMVCAQGQDYSNEDPNKKIIKQGLLGAGVGAISASASGGKAGKGALIGAGTNVIGGALLDTLTGPSQAKQPAVQYVQSAQPQYVQVSQPQYVQVSQPQVVQQAYPVQAQRTYQPVESTPVYVQQAPSYAPPQEDPNRKIIKQGLLGAGVGAISASASGGKAGKGALIGAGTNVIGGALLDTLMGGSQPQQQPQTVYVQQPPQYAPTYPAGSNPPKKKIIRKYDSDGKVVSEEEVWE